MDKFKPNNVHRSSICVPRELIFDGMSKCDNGLSSPYSVVAMSENLGVEENEASRFVDYTKATPWEEFCSEIETALKKWNKDQCSCSEDVKLRLKSMDLKMTMSFYDETAESILWGRFKRWFGYEKFACVSPDGRWSDVNNSTKLTISSAICCAIQSASLSNLPPVLLIPISTVKIDNTIPVGVFGYQLITNPHHPICCGSSRFIVVLESHVISNVDKTNSLYFMDGLGQFFNDKLARFSKGKITLAEGRYSCSLTELFRYNHDGTVLSSRTIIPNEYIDSNGAKVSDTFSEVSEYYGDFMISLTSLWSCFPCYNINSALLSQLSIQLSYPVIQGGKFMDNSRYTSFQPSKAKFDCWKISLSFKNYFNYAVKHIKTNESSRKVTVSSTLSGCLRRLCSFYIFANYCCSENESMKFMTSKGKQIPQASLPAVSAQLKYIIEQMCPRNKSHFPFFNNISTPATTSASPQLNKVDVENQIPDFFHYLFKRFSVPDFGNFPKHFNREDGENDIDVTDSFKGPIIDKPKIISACACWFEIVSVGIGSHAINMDHIGYLWKQCIAELRQCWEWDLPVYGLNGEPNISDITDANDFIHINPQKYHVNNECESSSERSDHIVPLWEQNLWYDKIDSKNKSHYFNTHKIPIAFQKGMNQSLTGKLKEKSSDTIVCMPNRAQSILIQKLQLLQFCILFKNEKDLTYKCTSPLYPASNCSPTDTQSSAIDFIANGNVPTARQSGDIKFPYLQRRSPLTDDFIEATAQLLSYQEPSSFVRDVPSVKIISSLDIDDDSLDNFGELPQRTVSDFVKEDEYSYSSNGLRSSSIRSVKSSTVRRSSSNSSSGRTSLESDFVLDNKLATNMKYLKASKPSLISDIKAFKAENPHANFESFLDYCEYLTPGCRSIFEMNASAQSCTVDNDYNLYQAVYDSCEPCSATRQRPLFKSEAEAEKCFLFLENLSPQSLSLHMIISSLNCVYVMIRNELLPWCNDDDLHQTEVAEGTNATLENEEFKWFLKSELIALREDINKVKNEALILLHSQSTGDTDNQAKVSIDKKSSLTRMKSVFGRQASDNSIMEIPSCYSLELVMRLDDIAVRIESLEELILRIQEISTVMMLPITGEKSRLVTDLAWKKESQALDDFDASTIFELVKFISRGNSYDHSWQSDDGREIGIPTKRVAEMKFIPSHAEELLLKADDDITRDFLHHNHFRLFSEVEQDKLALTLRFVNEE